MTSTMSMSPHKMVSIFFPSLITLEIIEYAKYLGIDPVADYDLLWIAIEGVNI